MKFTEIIKFVKAVVSRDGDGFQEVDCAFRGKNQTNKRLNPYGISSFPPKNSLGISFNISGYEDTAYVIVDAPKKRFTGLKEGELKIGNYETGANVYFKTDGSVAITSKEGAAVDLKADGSIDLTPKTGLKVNIIGSLEVSGKIETLVDFVSPGVSSYEDHVHSGVTSGGANTGGPA